jgi:hypothetical protein
MEKRYDGAEVLGKVSGLGRAEVMSIWEQVKANSAKLQACKLHRFEAQQVKLGQKMNCLNCGGMISLTDIGYYIRGYEAHGGNADDIWLGYHATLPTPPTTPKP